MLDATISAHQLRGLWFFFFWLKEDLREILCYCVRVVGIFFFGE